MLIDITGRPTALIYRSNLNLDFFDHDGNRVSFKELPEVLQNVFRSTGNWDRFSMIEFLVEYDGSYYLALEADFDRSYATDLGITYEQLVEESRSRAERFTELAPGYNVLFGKDTLRYDDGDCMSQVVVLVPCNVSKDELDRIGVVANRYILDFSEYEKK